MKEQIKKILENKKFKGKETMVVLILIGAVLAVVAFPIEKEAEKTDTESGQTEMITEENARKEYAEQLELRLEEILSKMEGVGQVEVMITLQASSREVVEKDFSTQQDNSSDESAFSTNASIIKEETTVYSDTGSGSTPYVIQEIYPEVEGVLVVAEGGGDSYVNLAIVEAIQALFGIDVHKIKIVKMNTN